MKITRIDKVGEYETQSSFENDMNYSDIEIDELFKILFRSNHLDITEK